MKTLTSAFAKKTTHELLLAVFAYVGISIFFLFKLIASLGVTAQQDWGIPLTTSVALNNFHSVSFIWSYNGFGNPSGISSVPFFNLLNAALSPLGFVGGAEIKLLSIVLVVGAGITMYMLARSFSLGFLSSILSGLFFMTTAVVFDWLMFGWIFYLIAYVLMPLMIIVTKKFIETNDLRYALLNGVILAIAVAQPTFILIYPLLGFIFVIFESKGNLKTILRGVKLTLVTLLIWFLSVLSFFTSSTATLSFYQGSYFNSILTIFYHLSPLINPIRLWGSTYNYQFETYFPKELILLSFLPFLLVAIGLLLRPHDKRVLFCSIAYLFVVVPYLLYNNLRYIVFNLPFGSIFEAPSIFLVLASIGIALLIGFTNQTISGASSRINNINHKGIVRYASFVIILVLIILSNIPWWTGQASGTPIPGAPTKLNLYQMPSDYTEWNSKIAAGNQYFVLYMPFTSQHAQIVNNTDFYLFGVNGVFTEVNNLPYVSVSNSTLFLSELFNGTSQVAESWGSYSIKYVVVYTNVYSLYNMDDILNRLSSQNGLTEIVKLPTVVVYENQYAKPIVYATNSETTTEITYQDPTTYNVIANSTIPYMIILNQVYSNGWVASVNGTMLPNTAHIQNDDGFNGWYINETGTMNIKIYYSPQTVYFASTLVSISVIIAIALYLVITTIRDVRRSNTNNKNSNKTLQ